MLSVDRRRIHWMRKEKLLKAKIDGGLGFKSMYEFNQAKSDNLYSNWLSKQESPRLSSISIQKFD